MKSSELIFPTPLPEPIASQGDKNNIPLSNPVSSSNLASIQSGFPAITSQNVNEGGLPPMRADFNGLFYLISDIKYYQMAGGHITFNQEVCNTIGGYPKGAVLANITDTSIQYYKSVVDDNTYNFLEEEYDPQYWQAIGVTIDVPIATTESLGAVQPDGKSIGVTEKGEISVLQAPIIDTFHPIGDPIITLNNTLNENEIWLEGGSVAQNTYANLFSVYQYNYTPVHTIYNFNGTLNGELNFGKDFVIAPKALTDYAKSNLTLPNNTSDFSFEIPVKITSLNQYNQTIIQFGTENTKSIVLQIGTSGQFLLSLSSNGTSWDITQGYASTAALSAGSWYMIKFAYKYSTKTYTAQYATLNNYTPQEYGKIASLSGLQYSDGLTFTASADFYYASNLNWYFGSIEPVNTTAGQYFNGYIDLGGVSLNGNASSVLSAQSIANFNLPDFRNRSFWGSPDGSFGQIEAGLPNATGSSGYVVSQQSSSFQKGALKFNAQSYGNGPAKNVNYSGPIELDLSWANSIYGNSDTVQPPSIKMRVKTRYQ